MVIRRFFRPLLHRPLALASLGALLPLLAASGTAGAALRPPLPPASPTQTTAPPMNVTATAAILMDARSGRVLYSRNPDLVWPPASTTKIMTALVALESGSLDRPILISDQIARFRMGTVVGLPAGVRIPLRDLLYGLMLQSGNDVALAIAEGVGGTVPAFVARMNAEAQRLGARNTHFTSPHGLYDRDHYSTAYDLALITRAAMENPTFRDIVKARRWTISLPGRRSLVVWNHNYLLAHYTGADGVKTGYVRQAGQTLVASATRKGLQLIAVVLHTVDRWGDASHLLSYGFAHYRLIELARGGEEVASVEVAGAEGPVPGVVPQSVFAALATGEAVERQVKILPNLVAPIRQGQQVGTVEYYASNRLVASIPLLAAKDVEAHDDLVRMIEWVAQFSGGAVQ